MQHDKGGETKVSEDMLDLNSEIQVEKENSQNEMKRGDLRDFSPPVQCTMC